jgi:hypothetical protein
MRRAAAAAALLRLLAWPADAGADAALSPSAIDARVRASWRAAGVHPAPVVDDAGFLRRLWLDLAGVIPPPDEVSAFLADSRPDKRARAADALLHSARFADHFATVWEDLLISRSTPRGAVDRGALHDWLRERFARNAPWNEIVSDLVSATGRNAGEGGNSAVHFLLQYTQAPPDAAGAVARLFLGVRLQCAQCHDHPSDHWKQSDFRSFAAIFAKSAARPVEPKPQPGMVRILELEDGAPERRGGDRPAALDGSDLSCSPHPRGALAAWMTARNNPWFARAVVNRMVALLWGRGIVEPVDDLRLRNLPVVPGLLEALANDFVAHGYDLRHLVRLLVATSAYQRAAAPAGGRRPADGRHFERHPLRPLGGEVLYRSLVAATGLDGALAALPLPEARRDKMGEEIRKQVRFLFDLDEETPAGEFEGTVPQALALENGELAARACSAQPGSALGGLLASLTTDAEKIDALYLRTLSRWPSAAELARWTAFVNAPRPAASPSPRFGAKQPAYEDLLWALINSSEFTLEH